MFRIHTAFILLIAALSVGACANSPASKAPTAAYRPAKPPRLAQVKPPKRPEADRPAQAVTTGSAINATTADAENLKREEALRGLKPNSTAWWAVHDEIEAARDKQLNRRLVICRGCFPAPASDIDATASISPRRD